MTLQNGESGTLGAFIRSQVIHRLRGPELAHLKDRDTFTAQIDFDELKRASLRCARGPLPLPQNVVALFRFHHRVERVSVSAFEGTDGVTAFTGVSRDWGKQITVVTKLEDGSRMLSFSFDDAVPVKTMIELRDK